jgi:hypothetical protein
VGFDGSPDELAGTRAGLRAIVLQPAALAAEFAVEQAERFRKEGSTGKPEKQANRVPSRHAAGRRRLRALGAQGENSLRMPYRPPTREEQSQGLRCPALQTGTFQCHLPRCSFRTSIQQLGLARATGEAARLRSR